MLPNRIIEPLLDPPPELPVTLGDNLLLGRSIFRRHPPHLRGVVFTLLRRASGRRMMLREHPVRVRENAAEQLEMQQNDWAYSKPVIILDVLWNLSFVVISSVILGVSLEEKPDVPLRLWVVGYAFQCLFHVSCIVFEFQRRRRRRATGDPGSNFGSGNDGMWDYDTLDVLGAGESNSAVQHLESVNTMSSFLWWLVGFYWVSVGWRNLSTAAPQLYWLCITFLAFDVLFMIICVAVACLIGFAVCCCLPCIIGILYTITDQERATAEDIEELPKFKFHSAGKVEKIDDEIQESAGGIMIECNTASPTERAISPAEAECCICLQKYDDGAQLLELPCRHHFHSTCIEKWLYINATCPLCKFNILKHCSTSDRDEV